MNKNNLYLTDLMLLKKEISEYLPARCNQIYQPENRKILLKLTSKEKGKFFILIEASPSKQFISILKENNFKLPKVPHSFCTKMRIHLGNRFLESLSILGVDRILYLKFSHDHSIVVEFFDHGNLILVDHEWNIVSLFRSHKYDDKHLLQPKQIYPLDLIKLHPTTESNDDPYFQLGYIESKNFIFDDYLENFNNFDENKKLREILISNNSPFVWIGKDFILHILSILNLSPNKKINKVDSNWINLFFKEFVNKFYELESSLIPIKYQLSENKYYFTSFESNKHKDDKKIEIINLSEVINKYWFEDIKKEDNKIVKKEIILDKKEKIMQGNQDRIKSLVLKNDRLNQEIEFLQSFDQNLKSVDLIFLNQDVSILESSIGNIHVKKKLNLWKNIEWKYSLIKLNKSKIEKIKIGNKNAIKKFKINKKVSLPPWNPPNWKTYWFQDFYWFYSTEGYLVVGGKNKEQNELIVKKYMEKDDIYLHSIYGKSPSTLIKKVGKDPPIRTLLQAPNYVTSRSSAWKEGSGDKVFWVYPNQVSKTAPSGQFVQAGSFIISGERNFIKADLSIGMALVFREKGDPPLCFKSRPETEEVLPTFIVGPIRSLEDYHYFQRIKQGDKKRGKMVRKVIDKWKNKLKSDLEKRIFKKLDIDSIIQNLPLKFIIS